MTFRLSINESDKKLIFQQQNFVDIQKDIIKVRQALSENITYEFPYTGNIVEFQVSISGTYKIEAWGARGGSSSSSTGPFGAYSKSFVLLNKDERIKILVGEKGYQGLNSGNYIHGGGGGGGTFIAKDRTPLCVAGGGGGFTYNSYSAVQSHACGQSTQRSANIGNGQATLKMGGIGAAHAGGGGGFNGNGGDGISDYGYGKGGYSFINGGTRQTSGTGYGTSGGIAYGGFGGGGSQVGGRTDASGAGGGGYTGGSASNTYTNQGGGGGSYFEGSYNHESSLAISGCDPSLPTNPGTNGNGFARLTFIISTPESFNNKVSCPYFKISIAWTFYAIFLSQ
jgi:hypothetical protein